MKLTKFEKKRQEILRKHQEEIVALEEAERKERQKLIEPVIDKITKVAGEEVRKILEKNPEILEEYSFKKREAAKVLSAAIQAVFDEDDADQQPASVNVEKPQTDHTGFPSDRRSQSETRDAVGHTGE